MTEFHFWLGVNPKSFTTSGINGTIPNHAKKQVKNAIEVIQKVLVGILLKFNKFKAVAFCEVIDMILSFL